MIVQITLHAGTESVSIHVQKTSLAHLVPSARLSVTMLSALAPMVSLEILKLGAPHVSYTTIYSSYLDHYLFTFNLWMFHFMFNNALWLHDSKFSAPQPECLVDPDCPSRLACINEKCENPCFTLSCGIRADCKVKNHRAICVCRPGLIGNPHEICEERKQMMINIEGFLLNFLFNLQTLSFDSWLQVWRWVPN